MPWSLKSKQSHPEKDIGEETQEHLVPGLPPAYTLVDTNSEDQQQAHAADGVYKIPHARIQSRVLLSLFDEAIQGQQCPSTVSGSFRNSKKDFAKGKILPPTGLQNVAVATQAKLFASGKLVEATFPTTVLATMVCRRIRRIWQMILAFEDMDLKVHASIEVERKQSHNNVISITVDYGRLYADYLREVEFRERYPDPKLNNIEDELRYLNAT